MRAVGRVRCLYGRRSVIVQCDPAHLPRLYSDAVDRHLRPVGKVMDVFGNIQAPYALVLCPDRCTVAAGEKLFAK